MDQRMDMEARVEQSDHEALRLWLRLLTCTNLIESHVRARLRLRFDTTLPRFDLAAQLARAPDGLKMGEVSRRLMVTGGNVTGLVDQLEAEGLVERFDDPDDRRAIRIRLTRAGSRWFTAMASEHEEWIAALFGELTASERATLYRLLARVKAAAINSEMANPV
jgi:DNA-binding MarR family transcriptional regulator